MGLVEERYVEGEYGRWQVALFHFRNGSWTHPHHPKTGTCTSNLPASIRDGCVDPSPLSFSLSLSLLSPVPFVSPVSPPVGCVFVPWVVSEVVFPEDGWLGWVGLG